MKVIMAKGFKTGGKKPIFRTETHKVCAVCKDIKSVDAFFKDAGQRSGYATKCNNCAKTIRAQALKNNPELKQRKLLSDKTYYQNNKHKFRNRMLKAAYKIDLEEYNELYNRYNGCCWICKKHQINFKKALAVDHCHSSGKIRGILCSHCNVGLGAFKDDTNLLRIALTYLKGEL